MAYDRDSFLAGLAVGRAMWLPTNTEQSAVLLNRQVPDPLPEETESEDEDAD